MVVEAVERRLIGAGKAEVEAGQVVFNPEHREDNLERLIKQLGVRFVNLDDPDYSFPLSNLSLPQDAKMALQNVGSQIRRIENFKRSVSRREVEVAHQGLRRYMILKMPLIRPYLSRVLAYNLEGAEYAAA